MSQLYLVCSASARRRRSQPAQTWPRSMPSARPRPSGSAIIVSRFFLLGVAAKHCTEEVSTSVSQKVVTGSLTLTSTPAYITRRSCSMQSSASSPAPSSTCSPLSSTRVAASG